MFVMCLYAHHGGGKTLAHESLIDPLREWLIDQALGEPDILKIFETACLRLSASGIPIARGRLVWQTLHPMIRAEQVMWNRGGTATFEYFAHRDRQDDLWMASPMRHVIANRLALFRRQLFGPNETLDFPVLHELKAQGYTDYCILSTPLEMVKFKIDADMLASGGILMTWATDRANGFSSDDLEALQSLQKTFALACKTVVQTRIANNVAETYLGSRAGRSVLDGNIRRGDGEEIAAVIWYSDMRNSTALAESLGREQYFKLLNAYFEAIAGPVVEHGGEVLDFIGDAVLGIFPFSDDYGMRRAAQMAAAALDDALAAARNANRDRETHGLERFGFGIGLNVGNVMFGNIGIPKRLAFSVIGQAVNEAARIEGMTKLLQKPVLASGRAAGLDAARWQSVGAHKLDGVLDPVELFALKAA